MTTYIAVTCQKGGVGKTTTCLSIAHGLALMSHNVLLVDLDPQGQSAVGLGLDPSPGVFNYMAGMRSLAECIAPTTRAIVDADGNAVGTLDRAGLTLLPGNRRTLSIPGLLKDEGINAAEVLNALGQGCDYAGYDFVVFDTPASGVLQESAIAISNVLVIPGIMEALALDSVAATLQVVKKLDNNLKTLILPTLFDKRVKEHGLNLELLRNTYGDMVAQPIPQRSFVKECSANGMTIWERKALGSPETQEAYTALLQSMGLVSEDELS